MNKLFYSLVTVVSLALFSTACAPSADKLKKLVEENPDIVFGAIEKHPDKFLEVVNKAVREGQVKARQKEEEEEKKRMDEEFNNPKAPVISENRAIYGSKDAPVTIVVYSDFECPYCERGYKVIQQIKENYKEKVRLVFKNLPLDFHPLAMPAAKYFEAIALQSSDKAYKFHDEVFENQNKFKAEGEKFLKAAAKKVGANIAKLEKDLNGDEVQSRIKADMEEARKFGFSGTPGFLVNGVSVRGAFPFEEFKKIIDRHLAGKAGNSGKKEG